MLIGRTTIMLEMSPLFLFEGQLPRHSVMNLKKGNQRIALLRVNQLIYQVGVGNYLGQNYGRIVQIEENSIKLREVVQDAAGDWVERMATLDLQEGGN